MNKLYQRINWQNYPSDSTPLNESNLNKMDAAVDGIDDRVVTLDVTKLPVSTANTMVKDVTFNESTGVFTITKLNGTKVTVNTALEKIATNFRYDHSTQKLILTLIDGTTQEVDLSALLTQYEFLNSSTIQFTIDSSGKVKASVVNGSITGDMLEPNYLANVTLQASKADTSAKNAKESEGKAAEYAESAKNSADSAEPVASTATGTNPTIQNSTNAPLIYGKFKGYTKQQMYSGKNLCDNNNFTLTAGTGTVQSNYVYQKINIADKLKSDTTYILSADVKIIAGTPIKISIGLFNEGLTSGSEIVREGAITNNHVEVAIESGSNASDFYYLLIYAGIQGSTAGNSIEFSNVMFRESTTDATYEPYVGGTVSPNPDYPQEINGLAKGGAIEVKTAGKNMLNNIAVTRTINGVTFTVNDDKSITANGTATAEVIISVGNFKPKPNKTYIFTSNSKTLSNSEYWRAYSHIANIDGVNTWRSDSPSNNYSYEFTPLTDTTIYNKIYIESGMTVNNLKFYPMIRPVEIADDTYEPYQGETTANIPTDAPLYEGDYIEYRADGTGVLHRKNGEYVLTENDNVVLSASSGYSPYFTIPATFIPLSPSVVVYDLISTHFKKGNPNDQEGNCIFLLSSTNFRESRLRVMGITTVDAMKTWLQSNPVTVVYKLAEPQEIELTAEQLAQFKQLRTFEPVTNVLCDGEVEMIYLKNTNGGKALASVRRGVEHADTATTATTATKATQDGNGNVIAETYYRKANFDKIVGGTVEPSGKTNVVYSVPTEVSSKGVVVQTNTSGTLINALSKATASISGFFSILYNAVKTKYLGRIDLGMSAIQNTYDFTSFAGYDRYTFVFKGTDANRSLFTRELLTIHNIEKNTSNVGKVCLNISNNYTFEPWVEMYPSRDKTYIVVQLTDTTGLTTLVSDLYVEVYGAMD